MPNCWPPTIDLSAAEQRYRIKAEVQRRIDAREITEGEAADLFDCLIREAKLGPRPLEHSPIAFWRRA